MAGAGLEFGRDAVGDDLAAAVEPDLRRQGAARHVEVERRQGQHAIRQHHMRVELADRQLGVARDFIGRVAHVGVQAGPALRLEGFHRQHAAGRLRRRHAPFLLAGAGIGAHQRAQVGKLQQARVHLARQALARRAGGKRQLAFDVAGTHFAAELVVHPFAATRRQGARQVAFRAEMRRFRQQHARQGIQARHAGPGYFQAHVERGQVRRARQRAFDGHAAAACAHVGLDGEGRALLLQRQHAARLAAALDAFAAVFARQLPGDAVARIVRDGVDVGAHRRVRDGIVQGHAALAEDHALQFQLPRRRLLLLVEGPVVLAILVAQQAHLRRVEAQLRDDDFFVQQGQGVERKRQLADSGQLRRLIRSCHGARVAQAHVLGLQVRPRQVGAPALLPRSAWLLPRQRQVACNGKGPAQRFAGARIEPGLGAVPVHIEQGDGGDDG